MTDEELREKYIFEGKYENEKDFCEVQPREGAHGAGDFPTWNGDLADWVLDKEGRWKAGRFIALRVRDRKTGKTLQSNIL